MSMHGRLKTAHTTLYFSPQLILQFYRGDRRVYQWFISKKTIYNFPTLQRESNIFKTGGPTSGGGGGGVQMPVSIETHKTCDFPGGGSDPLSPPLDPRMY